MPSSPSFSAGRTPYVVAVGASGGEGLQDLRALLAALPAGLAAAILVVLHRGSNQISYLQQVLQRSSALPVLIARQGDELRPGACYIGEPAWYLTMAAGRRAHLVEGAYDRYRNRTVDLLFTSVAEHAKARSIGVVLRGSLSDGSLGLAAVHEAGGATMVLGKERAAEPGMPANAFGYDGPIDFIGSVGEIGGEIVRRIMGPSTPPRRRAGEEAEIRAS